MFLLFPVPTTSAARAAIVPFIAAAAAAGCRHVVYISVLGADRARFIPHFTVEAALRQHIPDSTILRCGFFTQNLHRTISTHGIVMAAVYTLTRLGFNQQITTHVSDLLHRPAGTVEDYLRVSAWRWHQHAWT